MKGMKRGGAGMDWWGCPASAGAGGASASALRGVARGTPPRGAGAGLQRANRVENLERLQRLVVAANALLLHIVACAWV